ncbi:sensor histidine kinase [Cohnella luojiensis]|uniref:HAMP domain-containing protein n=1 Tax=Cohnella luojiensis TaxID=652876 RepID=A0A4Y8LZ83_9BACL|nr:histidine kinase [Cohnella luojiensis]TFE27504.1 HAMP domain-containing protein [Cohnella luojiensis]
MLKFPASSFRKTLFVRLVVTYLIVILPVILLGVYLYNWSYRNASQDLSKATLSQLSDYLGDLNREIDWMEIQQFDLLEDSDLNKMAVTWDMMDSVERRTSTNYLVHRLTTLKSSSAYIKDVEVHIRSINKNVSASNAVHDFDEESFNYFRSIAYKKENRLINYNNALHLGVSKQGGIKGEEPLFIVQIELDTQKLKDSLRQVNMYPESRSFLLLESSEFSIGSDGESDKMLQSYMEAVKGKNGNASVFTVEGQRYHIDAVHSDTLALSVATYLPEEAVKRPLNKFVTWAWLFAFTSFCAIIIYSFSTYRFVHKPLLLLVQSFRRMEGGALDIQIEHKQKDEFGYLYNRFNLMLRKLQALIDQDFKQKLMMQRSELKQLQSQINPHFLYNSFFILNSLAKTGDLERIEQFTIMLGEYFRFITRNGEDNVKLAEEIKHSRMYTEIQKLRFSRRIRVRFDELPEDMEAIRVPRLIIQPLIENAYEHCLEKMTEEGQLRVTFESAPAEASIIVEDNGSMSDIEIEALSERLIHSNESHEMTGMINIHRRILLIYGEGSGLFLSRNELNGLKVTVRIKLGEVEGHV